MKRFKLILAVAVTMAAIMAFSAAPAMAAEDDFCYDDFYFFYDDDFCFHDDDFFFFHDFDDDGFQENEQEVESGNAEQSFDIEGGGDNSNQSVGLQGVNNTGNAVSNLGVTQIGNDDAEIEVEDAGNFTISPELSLESNQKVNQSAAASGR